MTCPLENGVPAVNAPIGRAEPGTSDPAAGSALAGLENSARSPVPTSKAAPASCMVLDADLLARPVTRLRPVNPTLVSLPPAPVPILHHSYRFGISPHPDRPFHARVPG